MVDVCDVPVISSVCDVAGDAAGSLVTAPFDWLAQGMGHAAGLDVRVGVDGLRLDHDGRRHQQPVHEGLQHPLRCRRLRDARLLHAPSHRRHDPARTGRAVPSGPRTGEVDPRLVRRARPAGDRLGDHRPALHRHRPRRRHQHGADGRPDRPARRPASADSTSPHRAPERSSPSSSPASRSARPSSSGSACSSARRCC